MKFLLNPVILSLTCIALTLVNFTCNESRNTNKSTGDLHSSPKFLLLHHLLTAGLFQEFLFCPYSIYLCALGSTTLPCLLAALCWCRRDRENTVFSTTSFIVVVLRTEFSRSTDLDRLKIMLHKP